MFDGLDAGVQALLILPGDLLRWAERVHPHLAKMADGSGGRYETADLYAALAARRMQLWVAVDGTDLACVMLTEIMHYPRLRAMRCIGVVGHRPRRWLHLLGTVERAARERFGCSRMEAMHQPGHARLLRTGGWAPFHVLSEKAL